ncbi:MAG: DegV family protein [Subdoligranulum sp.]|nr:DegV family protein [Subdoligranulum sp.]
MIRIFADSSTLYSPGEARQAGFTVAPLSVTIRNKTYREFDEILPEEFISLIDADHLPTSSQPSPGDVLELYEQYPGDTIINIAMADGLSGTYASAAAAAGMCEGGQDITVLNSRTLCGPHRYLVENAVRMAQAGAGAAEILQRTKELIETSKSFLIPSDFGYLRRGGRLSPLVSYVGAAVRFAPLMTQTPDGMRLTLAGVKRNFLHAAEAAARTFQQMGVDADWRLYITHAGAPKFAGQARRLFGALFPQTPVEILPLSPVFITHGGPGCVALQAIHA